MACPDQQKLQQFRAGKLIGPAKQQVTTHLNHCKKCQQQLKSAEASAHLAEASSLGGVVKEPNGPEDLYAGRVFSERYTLLHELGKGGMGSVWAARDNKLQRQVAIKMLNMNVMGTNTMQSRFQREAVAIAQLHSPHIVEVHDYGIDEFRPYMVMEMLEGEDLADRLRKAQRLPLNFVMSLSSQIGKALRAAHTAGFVHRDLKPANIFLVSNPDDEVQAKVLDFGVAKVLDPTSDPKPLENSDSHLTMPGMLLGTPPYMSPEQWRKSQTVDHRTDLWALAVIMYRALTGELPFKGKDLIDFAASIRHDEPTPPSQVNSSLPATIDDFFKKALAKEPDARFQSARELASGFRIAAGASLGATWSDSVDGTSKNIAVDTAASGSYPAPVVGDTTDTDATQVHMSSSSGPDPQELATLLMPDDDSINIPTTGKKRSWLVPAVALSVVAAGTALILNFLSPGSPNASESNTSPVPPAAATSKPASNTDESAGAEAKAEPSSTAAPSASPSSAAVASSATAKDDSKATKTKTSAKRTTRRLKRMRTKRKARPKNNTAGRAVDVY